MVGSMGNPMIRCRCGREFASNALPNHQPKCLGPAPTLADLYRVGRVEPAPGGCLEWHGKIHPEGYGVLPGAASEQLGEQHAHRAAMVLVTGQPLPAGAHVLHSCDNPPCCAEQHLRVGTPANNMADMMARGRGRGQVQAVELETRECVVCGAEHRRKPYDSAVTCSASCRTTHGWRQRAS